MTVGKRVAQIRAMILERRSRADRVLGACSLSTVQCWSPPREHGLEIAMFLQFHDDAEEGYTPGTARAQLAYRNYRPETIPFMREVRITGGSAEDHNPEEIHFFRAGRTKGHFFRESLAATGIQIVRSADPAQVITAVELKSPQPFGAEAIDELVIEFPEHGGEVKCSCCSRSFPS